jgi:hypothetical protein
MRTNGLKSMFCLAGLGLLLLGSPSQAGQMAASHGTRSGAPELIHSSRAGRLQTAAAEVCTVDPDRETVITDLSVVEDCQRTTWTGDCADAQSSAVRGAWTFGRAAEGIFGTQNPKKLSNRVRQWLNQWMDDQVVNGETVHARTAMRDLVIRPWQAASGGNDLDMTKAPFRLLAFVLRMDIRDGVFDPVIRSAGELHVIFNVLDRDGEPTPFNVILEYRLISNSCQQTLEFARNFHQLGSYEFGPEYNAALEAITDRILTPGAGPGRLNGSALETVRTNESFLGSPWEMRSFTLARDEADGGASNARLVAAFLPLTPQIRYQGTQTLADYVNLATPDIVSGAQAVPVMFRGEPFLAGVAHNNLDLGWDGPTPCSSIDSPLARRFFSTFTCQGCHGPETGTQFQHVRPRQPGQPAELSAYMTGVRVTDSCGVTFGLNEKRRLGNDLCFLLSRVCQTQ